jgi:outer membrane protein OmpA-like peptidoglycan-associated protein
MKYFPKAQLAIAIALAAGLTAGCNNNPERASTNEREEAEVTSVTPYDTGIPMNSSADREVRDNDNNYAQRDNEVRNTQQQNRNQVSSISEESTVLFEFDSADLTDSAKESLDEIAEALQGQGDAVESITIRGYADAMGPDSYNEQLSESRAKNVRNYLRDQGVNADSWEVEGRGEADPVASNEDTQGRSENRRVVIELSGSNVEGLTSSYSPD